MAKSDDFVRFGGHLQAVAFELSQRLGSRGITIAESLEGLAQPRGSETLDRIADAMASVVLVSSSTEEPVIEIPIPALPRPTFSFLQKRFPDITSIERDISPTGEVTLHLETVPSVEVGSIMGPIRKKKYERWLVSRIDVVLGYQQAVWLGEHQNEFPALALLDNLLIDFPAIVVAFGDNDTRSRRTASLRLSKGNWFSTGVGSAMISGGASVGKEGETGASQSLVSPPEARASDPRLFLRSPCAGFGSRRGFFLIL